METIVRNPDVMWREEEEVPTMTPQPDPEAGEAGTSVLFCGGTMLSLNAVGTEVWKICDGRSVDDIVLELLEQFEVEEDRLRADVRAFLDELNQRGFIRYGK